MKKIFFAVALVVGVFLMESASAQVNVNLKLNIAAQPVWGPVGYDYVEYYYMPDIDAYYDVPNRQYIYLDGGHWIFAASLPSRFDHYDLNSGYKVVINEPKPYLKNESYRSKYNMYKGHHGQEIIRNSHDPRYFEIKEHPEHDKWEKDHH